MSPRRHASKLLFIGLVCIGLTVLTVSISSQYWPLARFEQPAVLHQFIPRKNEYAELQNPWFLENGKEYPKNYNCSPKLFPEQDQSDRILEQLMYVPEDYRGNKTVEKVILSYRGLESWHPKPGSEAFKDCPVSRCVLTVDKSRANDVDAIFFYNRFVHPQNQRPKHQVWIMQVLESPYVPISDTDPDFVNVINWTASYRRDSDIVTPYGKWFYYNPNVRQKLQNINYAANKTKKVAWYVSNCHASNNRLQYAHELSKYIEVDIYGNCGTLKCPNEKNCWSMLDNEYKFYLAFENANCHDYITEKFYSNSLGHNVLPIVMGASPEDYEMFAPEGSYIHVDEFAGPQQLAEYLHRLDRNDDFYNSYFTWKGTGEVISTHTVYFWCRLCALMHTTVASRYYQDMKEWWEAPGTCTKKFWRDT